MDEKARDVESSSDDLNNRLQKLRARFMGSGEASVVKQDDDDDVISGQDKNITYVFVYPRFILPNVKETV